MSDLAENIRREIERNGPMPFRRYMELALYDPEHGYYRRSRDPFGKHRDFYTAEQVQPVFGILIANYVRSLYEEMGRPEDFTVVELGAGREEMREAFSEFRYVPVDIARGALPDRFAGVLFTNEFFDALPIEVAVRSNGELRDMLVDSREGAFVWAEGGRVRPEVAEYVSRYGGPGDEGNLVEINLDALRWIERIANSLERGFVFTIDYGYTTRELIRFPQGTLMSYHRHVASEDVLKDPGARDITAHVSFTALQEHGAGVGLETVRFETLAQALLRAGEADQFASALDAPSAEEQARRRLQLKTLLFGMGETFRTLLQKKVGSK